MSTTLITFTLVLVATIGPLVLSVRMLTEKDSVVSVSESLNTETKKEPELLSIVNGPLVLKKSFDAEVVKFNVQYNVVLLTTLVVTTSKIPEAPSTIEPGVVTKA